ncbi:MAG TPA: hypothetical protein VH583_00540 [Vicinamibacterales bacterium]|jgi:hypothetical protein
MRVITAFIGAAALVAFLAPGAHADEWNKRTYLTFSGPVEVPGATLAAGTYTFEIADPDAARHVIRVSEKDTNKPIALFMTIPMQRAVTPEDNLVLFTERPADAPQAIQAWFYPGDNVGEEFVYPKSQAVKIAKANRKPVLSTADSSTKTTSESDRMAEMKNAKIGRVNEKGEMTSTSSNNTPAATTSSSAKATTSSSSSASNTNASATPAPSNPKPSSATASNSAVGTSGQQSARHQRKELPRTASDFGAIELLSGLAFAGALAAGRLRRALN